MARDLSAILGSAFREIRKSTARTQERMAEMTGLSQSYVSAVERGESGLAGLRSIGESLEKAGVDPLQLFRIALARESGEGEQADLLLLWTQADEATRTAILMLLRSRADAGRAAR